MRNLKRTLTAAGVTRETLEETPQRALQLLVGVSTRPTVRALLAKRGYTKAEHQRGWDLIGQAVGREIDERASDVVVDDAIAELDNWDEPSIRLIAAALTRHPEERKIVLSGVEPVSGPAAVLNAENILGRLNGLAGTKGGDAALATLAARGLDETERKRLAALVKVAKTARDITPEMSDANGDEAYEQALLELRDWYTEWAEIARLVVKRRDHLIRLGLAERRVTAVATETDDTVADNTPFLPLTPPTVT